MKSYAIHIIHPTKLCIFFFLSFEDFLMELFQKVRKTENVSDRLPLYRKQICESKFYIQLMIPKYIFLYRILI